MYILALAISTTMKSKYVIAINLILIATFFSPRSAVIYCRQTVMRNNAFLMVLYATSSLNSKKCTVTSKRVTYAGNVCCWFLLPE